MVGAVRFELTTSCTRNKRATRLRYAPTLSRRKWRLRRQFAIEFLLILYWVSDGGGSPRRSAPVLGRSNVGTRASPNGIGRTGTTSARCARGRAMPLVFRAWRLSRLPADRGLLQRNSKASGIGRGRAHSDNVVVRRH